MDGKEGGNHGTRGKRAQTRLESFPAEGQLQQPLEEPHWECTESAQRVPRRAERQLGRGGAGLEEEVGEGESLASALDGCRRFWRTSREMGGKQGHGCIQCPCREWGQAQELSSTAFLLQKGNEFPRGPKLVLQMLVVTPGHSSPGNSCTLAPGLRLGLLRDSQWEGLVLQAYGGCPASQLPMLRVIITATFKRKSPRKTPESGWIFQQKPGDLNFRNPSHSGANSVSAGPKEVNFTLQHLSCFNFVSKASITSVM